MRACKRNEKLLSLSNHSSSDSIIDLLTTWKKVQFNKLQQINIFPTLARQSGIPFEQISEALTHSDTTITKTYVNTPNVIKNARW